MEKTNKQEKISGPPVGATALLLMGLLVAYMVKGSGLPSEIARGSAVIVGIAITASFAADWILAGGRNLFRIDNAAIVALYFLTLFEFLFPQNFFNVLVTREQVVAGLDLVLLGVASLAVGRHLAGRRTFARGLGSLRGLSSMELFWLALLAFVAGHVHQWVAVGFNPVEWLSQMTGARFTQDWQRGKLGGWNTLLHELHWATYLVPAVAAILWVRRSEAPPWTVVGSVALAAVTVFGGLSSGTRYQFAFYLLSFVGGWFLSLPKVRVSQLVFNALPIFALFIAAVFLVVNFRTFGVMDSYRVLVSNRYENISEGRLLMLERLKEGSGFKFIVDRNLHPISVMTTEFPARYPFLEEEVLAQIMFRSVPRALWPDKPESLSVTMEAVLGFESATIASTFVGEGYMAYGRSGTILFGLGLGVLAGLWNRFSVDPGNSTQVLLYSTGFVWMSLAVRSVVWITVGFLPVLFLVGYAWFLLPLISRKDQVERLSNTQPSNVTE
ncbi:MAG: hypothetical protein AAF357_01400 [Verrucomicrobiota bacterium]